MTQNYQSIRVQKVGTTPTFGVFIDGRQVTHPLRKEVARSIAKNIRLRRVRRQDGIKAIGFEDLDT